MDMIESSWTELLLQSPMTVDEYVKKAVACANKNGVPTGERTQFICAYIAACTADYNNAASGKVMQGIAVMLANQLDAISSNIEQILKDR